MHRDASDAHFHKYVCDTCGAYVVGPMSGFWGTEHLTREGKPVFDKDTGKRIIPRIEK